MIERAAREGIRHLVLLTQTDMKAAHHLYEEAGFSRLPERDWSPEPGVTLLAYGLVLEPDQPATRHAVAPGWRGLARLRGGAVNVVIASRVFGATSRACSPGERDLRRLLTAFIGYRRPSRESGAPVKVGRRRE